MEYTVIVHTAEEGGVLGRSPCPLGVSFAR